jgi:hypothetical protein
MCLIKKAPPFFLGALMFCIKRIYRNKIFWISIGVIIANAHANADYPIFPYYLPSYKLEKALKEYNKKFMGFDVGVDDLLEETARQHIQ